MLHAPHKAYGECAGLLLAALERLQLVAKASHDSARRARPTAAAAAALAAAPSPSSPIFNDRVRAARRGRTLLNGQLDMLCHLIMRRENLAKLAAAHHG